MDDYDVLRDLITSNLSFAAIEGKVDSDSTPSRIADRLYDYFMDVIDECIEIARAEQ